MDPAQEQPPQRATPRQIAAGVACLLLLAAVVVYGAWYVLIGGSISYLHDKGHLLGMSRDALHARFGPSSQTSESFGWNEDWMVGTGYVDLGSFVAVRYDKDGRVVESGAFTLSVDVPERPFVMWLGSFRGQNVAGDRTRRRMAAGHSEGLSLCK